MIDNCRYEDVETLAAVEQPCLTALFLQSDLALLRLFAEHKSVPAKNTAATLVEIVDCLERLFASLKDESIRLALQEVHATEGRKVRFAEGWYGSYCEATRAAGRSYYRAIYAAADPDGYVEWLLVDTQNSRGCKQLSAAAIEARWSEIAKAVLDLPEVDFIELEFGIRNEWIEVRGTNPAPPEPVLPILESTESGDFIRWEDTRFPVTEGWANAFRAMLEKKGQPVGIQKYLGKIKTALGWLKANAEPLHDLIKKGRGKSGYRLIVFDPPVNP